MLTASRSILIAGLVSLLAACTAETDSSDGAAAEDDAALTSGALSDAALASTLARTPAKLTVTRAKQLVAATVNPAATTARLKLLNDFIGTRIANPSTYTGDEYEVLGGEMEAILWETPRDFVSTPAGYGGQTIKTTVTFDGTQPDATRLKIVGVATHDYTVAMTVAGYRVTVERIPAGSTPSDTAKLIGDALQAANQNIADSIPGSFSAIGGDHFDAPSGFDDVEITTTGDTVEILVALNG
jgi:hypothetical protein